MAPKKTTAKKAVKAPEKPKGVIIPRSDIKTGMVISCKWGDRINFMPFFVRNVHKDVLTLQRVRLVEGSPRLSAEVEVPRNDLNETVADDTAVWAARAGQPIKAAVAA